MLDCEHVEFADGEYFSRGWIVHVRLLEESRTNIRLSPYISPTLVDRVGGAYVTQHEQRQSWGEI